MSHRQPEITVTEIRSSPDQAPDPASPEIELLKRIPNLPQTFFNNDSARSPAFLRRYLVYARQPEETGNRTLAVAACGVGSPGSRARVSGPDAGAQVASSITASIFTTISKICERSGTTHILAVIDKTDRQSGDSYREHGFAEVHDILHLVYVRQSPAGTGPMSLDASPVRLRLTPVGEDSFAGFLSLVEATYQLSDDCPGLEDRASLDEVRSRWKGTPAAQRADAWYRASMLQANQLVDVGCLVLDLFPESSSAELVYLGVIPAHRGKGLGHELVAHALRIVLQFEKNTLTVSVDAGNAKALSCYNSHGFVRYAESTVLLKTLS